MYNDKIHLNDATFYLNNLINKFQSKFNRTTIEVILEDDELNNNFKMEINDQLFIQYYLQVNLIIIFIFIIILSFKFRYKILVLILIYRK